VPPLRLALEAGAALVKADDGLDLPFAQLLLRLELTDWLELRLQNPGLTVPIDNAGVPVGTDGGAGFKVAVALYARVGLS
jgi:hypothetical protein